MKVHLSALKHGVEEADAVQAAEWPLWIEPLADDGPPHRELRLGFDTGARLLETVASPWVPGSSPPAKTQWPCSLMRSLNAPVAAKAASISS